MTFRTMVSRRNFVKKKNSVSQIYRLLYYFLSRFFIKTNNRFKKRKEEFKKIQNLKSYHLEH